MAVVTRRTEGTQIIVEKRLSSREMGAPEARVQLETEATLLEKLGGVATPRLVSRGEDAGGPFLRMEHVPWPTLAARLEAGPPWTPESLVTAARAAYRTLDAIHAARDATGPLDVVHADLSPANVASSADGARVVVLDLGLARWRESAAFDGTFRGTVAYVAPEVAAGTAPTRAADVFALAASLAHAATGAPPRPQAMLAVALVTAAETELAPSVAAALEAGGWSAALGPLLRCLAHDPAARPTAAEAAELFVGA
jgi:eukaryotic-like serine/threonine-protein kinase